MSNIVTFVVDDLDQRFCNLYPLDDLTEPWHLPAWLDHYDIKYNTVSIQDASAGDWYPVGINFWNFEHDYLKSLAPRVIEKMSQGMRLLFYYRETDSPWRIRQHILDMSHDIGINPDLILLVSGNTCADQVPGCMSWWHFDISYYFQNQHQSVPVINQHTRDRKITCLSRLSKNWREYFVYNLSRFNDGQNYISYGNHIHETFIYEDVELWNEHNLVLDRRRPLGLESPTAEWRAALPLRADDLSIDQHNDHTILINDHFQNSYWNVVLETLLDTEDSIPGVFVTEKTLKPIRNGQSFLVLGTPGTLAMLKDQGYQTFHTVIDEQYDTLIDHRERWYSVYLIAKYLMTLDHDSLQDLQKKCYPMIEHNQQHFQRSRAPALKELLKKLCH